jgi:endothelin-converting enzyme/putative endopeptidase
VQALLASLDEEVDALDWMTPETRRQAHAKLRTLDAQIGYPDTWQDYSALTLDRRTYWENLVAARRFAVRASRALVGKPTDRGSWQLPPSSPDAYIEPQLHEIVLPAGFLQAPAFSLAADDAEVLGAIGAGVAHDLIHGIDLLGADFDTGGAPRNWWTDADRAGLEQRGQCVRDQFDGYLVAPGLHLHGKQVFGEAVADLGGARVALRVLQRSLAAHPLPVVDGRTAEQRLFVSLAAYRGDEARPEAERAMVESDIHPVARFRILGTLSNLPDFAAAFACPAGAPMVRTPERRCSVW